MKLRQNVAVVGNPAACCVFHLPALSATGLGDHSAMPSTAGIDFVLLLTDVFAAVLASVCLGLEFLAAERWAKRAPGLFALFLGAMAVLLWPMGRAGGIAAGLALLAAFSLAAWAIRFDAVRSRISR